MSGCVEYNLTDNLFDPSSLPDGAPIDFWVQILIDDKARKLSREYLDVAYPKSGIVREIKKLQSLDTLPPGTLKEALLGTMGIDVQDIEVQFDVSIASVEIEGMPTFTYQDFIQGEVTREEFIDSLPIVVINSAVARNRVPGINEVILLKYQNFNDFTSVFFDGYPSETPKIDTNLATYKRKRTNSGRAAFEAAADTRANSAGNQ